MAVSYHTSRRPTLGSSRGSPSTSARHPAALLAIRRTVPAGRSTSDQQLGIVLTGGSKGLGFALAQQFLAAGDKVVICGRSEERLKAAERSLQPQSPEQLSAIVCDVSKADDVDRLMDFSRERLGTIHRWINNAGEVTANTSLTDIPPSEISRVVGTNVLGSLLCARAAVAVMQQQQASQQPTYHIFNMGFSSWGASFSKSACTHKSTKMALTQLSKSLAEELRAAGVTSIGVHNLSPGMVLTDLLLQGASPVARRFFNALAEEPETVAADLAPRIRAVQGTGTSIDYLSPAEAVARVISGVPQIIHGGRFFDRDGNRVTRTSALSTSSTTATATGAAGQLSVSGSRGQEGWTYNKAGVRVLTDIAADKY